MGGMIGGAVFILAGVVVFFLGLKEYRVSLSSKDWPLAEGSILESFVEERQEYNNDNWTTNYYPHVIYTYYVMDQEYSSDRITIGSNRGYGRRAKAEKRLADYQAGQSVIVSYDPDRPGRAVLEAGATGGAKGTLFMGVVFVGLGLVMFVSSFNSYRAG